MNFLLHPSRLILRADTDAERDELLAWKAVHGGHVLLMEADDGDGLSLHDLGPQPTACREPLNVLSDHADPQVRLISNFAHTPFVLEGLAYQSVEGFWQGLKFADPDERRRLAELDGPATKRAGGQQGYGEFVSYRGSEIRVGSSDHWRLMHVACLAKFTQNDAARAALLATAPRWLMHRVRRESRAIPGPIMADIWMRIRDKLSSDNS
jgi:predicted NAD-dependent protein-ADP-ribosyltransferase YbiA (DUF1768 family)